ncbi:MAG TPA: hypothetical protein VFI73_11885 [Candidatus Nitrosopolaris sp.]|nr:hypothetical protein [Candidatus Nitrosopolaris sp.]
MTELVIQINKVQAPLSNQQLNTNHNDDTSKSNIVNQQLIKIAQSDSLSKYGTHQAQLTLSTRTT